MFSEEQLDVIREVGKQGLSLKVAASRLGMTFSKFSEEFQDNEEAQLAFEKGQAQLEVEVNTVARKGMMEGDAKKFEFFANSVLNMGGKGSKGEAGNNKLKKAEIPKLLLNPELLLEVDDGELARKMQEKADGEEVLEVKKPKKSKSKDEDLEDDE